MTSQGVDELESASIPQFDLAVIASSHQNILVGVEGERKDVAFVAFCIFS